MTVQDDVYYACKRRLSLNYTQVLMFVLSRGRLESGVASEEPPWLLDTPEEERIAHCIDEHKNVWDDLRAGRQ